MKFTLGKLIEIRDPLKKLMNSDGLPFAVSYRMSSAIDVLDTELKKVEKYNNDLVKKYGKENKETGMFIVEKDGEKWMEFLTEREKLLNEEFELNIPPVKAGELLTSTVKLSPLDINDLKKIGVLID